MQKKSLNPPAPSPAGNPSRGRVMVSKTPVAPGSVPAPLDQVQDGELLLPHERDESNRNVAHKPDPRIEQAKRDIDAGLVDTDMRATAGLDAKRREQLVPGPGGKPPSTPTPRS